MSLDTLLQQQQEQLERLLDLTEQELALIVQRKALELPPLTEQKQQLLLDIQATDNQLCAHPNVAELTTTYQPRVDALRTLMAQCQERNQVAEQVLEQSLAGTRQLANILSRLHERQSMTYDQKGHTKGINKGAGFKV
ncbi:flagellar export chaperone FlgN [Oceanimonas sp. CHS3-5]|uniref:flagellar export chaperone FlgN n=1 Tax=Oceanimonas sp. CHS3-5 TaxID=3068186 RepID=UPI00273EB76E|nr:flagellar export chaperone FlgN [Oceanimonas sp. CHS3-5]MDP5292300.1 flagellar export chaperone FlgN [Oceanimonas sp. CHS3-5]